LLREKPETQDCHPKRDSKNKNKDKIKIKSIEKRKKQFY